MLKVERCGWCEGNVLYEAYHDQEWGVPQHDDRMLFEFLVLEGAQAGLSWITVLKKRSRYREVFLGFDPEIIAVWGAAEITLLMQDAGIIRNRAKITGTVAAARLYLDIEAQQGFSNYLWDFVDGRPIVNHVQSMHEVPAQTDLSARLARDLKQKGFKFCGPTIIYAFMQAVGLVNDHLVGCHRHEACQQAFAKTGRG